VTETEKKPETEETEPESEESETEAESEKTETEAESETEAEKPAVLGSVLSRTRLDDPSSRIGLLKIDVSPRWLTSGGTLVIDLPKRVTCATCDGGGCSRCSNSGGFRIAEEHRQTPVRVEMAASSLDSMRIRVPLQGREDVDLLLLEIASKEVPSALVRYVPRRTEIVRRPAPARTVSPTGIISTVVALTALMITIVLALIMGR
jgi:hypothetical protein